MKATTIHSILTATVVLFLVSCGGGSTNGDGPQLKDTGDLEQLKKEMLTNYGDDQEVYQLILTASGELSSSFSYATAYYIKDGKDYLQTFKLMGGKYILDAPTMANESFQKEFFLKKKQGKKKIQALNFDEIAAHFASAEQMLSEKYENAQLNDYTLKIDNATMQTSEFTVHTTKIGESPTQQGNMEVTDFYEFDFEVNNSGELILTE